MQKRVNVKSFKVAHPTLVPCFNPNYMHEVPKKEKKKIDNAIFPRGKMRFPPVRTPPPSFRRHICRKWIFAKTSLYKKCFYLVRNFLASVEFSYIVSFRLDCNAGQQIQLKFKQSSVFCSILTLFNCCII